jgi:hypothetical protein
MWEFVMPPNLGWTWRRLGEDRLVVARSDGVYQTLHECISVARRNGFRSSALAAAVPAEILDLAFTVTPSLAPVDPPQVVEDI